MGSQGCGAKPNPLLSALGLKQVFLPGPPGLCTLDLSSVMLRGLRRGEAILGAPHCPWSTCGGHPHHLSFLSDT